MPLRNVIALAYGINPNFVSQLIDGRNQRILATPFDIQAQPPHGAPASATLVMLRTLLADRFQLRSHFERREIPVYAFQLSRQDRLGRSLRRSAVDCDLPGARKPLPATSTTAAAGRPPTCRSGVSSVAAPNVYSALAEQLGIDAKRSTAPFDVLVIDSVQMPTAN